MSFLNEARDIALGLLGRVGLGGRGTLFGIVFGLISFFGTIALTGAVLVRLPSDYLTNPESVRVRVTGVRARVWRLLRHLIGILLILIGLILSIPGVPGQGLLTILAGLFISELPGTNRLLRRFLRSPKVLAAVNSLRGRYKHPPLEAP